MSIERVRSTALAERRGKELAREFSEIADDYRKGYTLLELALAYSPDYLLSQSVAQDSIWVALTRLIESEELASPGRVRCKAGAKYRGSLGEIESFKRRVSAFGMTKSKRKAASHKGGKIGGHIAEKNLV